MGGGLLHVPVDEEVEEGRDVVGVRVTQDRNVDPLRPERLEGARGVLRFELASVRDDDLRADPHHDRVALPDIDEDDLRGQDICPGGHCWTRAGSGEECKEDRAGRARGERVPLQQARYRDNRFDISASVTQIPRLFDEIPLTAITAATRVPVAPWSPRTCHSYRRAHETQGRIG